jgi:hypothetical protein
VKATAPVAKEAPPKDAPSSGAPSHGLLAERDAPILAPASQGRAGRRAAPDPAVIERFVDRTMGREPPAHTLPDPGYGDLVAAARAPRWGASVPRTPVEHALGHDLGSMSEAMGLAAGSVELVPSPALSAGPLGRAAASGNSIFFDPGRVPEAPGDRRALLVHELAHVGQMRRPGAAAPAHAVEAEAAQIADAARTSPNAATPPALTASSGVAWGENGPAHVDLGSPATVTAAAGGLVFSTTALAASWSGDPFSVTVSARGAPKAGSQVDVEIALRYTGKDVTSLGVAEWSTSLEGNLTEASPSLPRGEPATAPRERLELHPVMPGPGIRVSAEVDVARTNQPNAPYLVLSLGGRFPDLIVYDSLETVGAWSPPLRRHTFTLHVAGRRLALAEREFVLRSPDALPVETAKQVAAPLPESLPESTVETRSLLDAAASALAATRAAPDVGLGNARALDLVAREIERRRGLATSDARTRQGAADLLLAIDESTPHLRMLHALADPAGYLGGEAIAKRAGQFVHEALGMTIAYITVALDGDRGRTAGFRRAAMHAIARLPFQIADLYLKVGGGLDRLEAHQRELAADIAQTRNHTRSGARPIDRILGISAVGNALSAADRLRAGARDLQHRLEQGDTRVLTDLFELTVDAERISGILAIRAAWEQFNYFAEELDTLLDPVLGLVGSGARRGLAHDYRNKFDRLLRGLEGTKRLDPARANAAIAAFNATVSPRQFSEDVELIQSRLKNIAVVRLIAKIVAITALAAIGGAVVGSAVGAGLSTAARVLALGRGATFVVVGGGTLLAEAGAFTFISRTGESTLIGPPQRSFSEDFAINLVTLGVLRGVGRAYGAWRPAFRATSPRLFAAGGIAAGAASAHVFGELVHLLETHKAMTGEERAIAVAQNLALVGVLHLGRYFSQPLEARITRSFARLIGSDRIFSADLARLEARRATLVKQAMELGAKQGGDPAEAARVLAAVDEQFRAELALLQQAARYHTLPAGELRAAVASHVRALATLELRFAQEGAPSPLGIAASFRRAAPGVVEMSGDPGTRAFLEAYYDERGGTLRAEGERLVGELDGRRIQYIPRLEARGQRPARTPHAASLESSLGDLRGRVDVRESSALSGRTTRVRTIDGRVTIEVGKDASSDDIRDHLDDARTELRFSGPAGRLRALSERAATLLGRRPGRGTLGDEAERERVKLEAARARLLELEATLSPEARGASEAQRAERLADIERQIEYYKRQIGSYERGRGYVAAFDTTPEAVTELRQRFPADRVTADGERLIFNDTLELARATLEGLDRPMRGAPRASGLEELVDLSRALRDAGGDPANLPDLQRVRFAALQAQQPDVAVRPTTPPVRSIGDPLRVADGASQPVRVESAAARAARLARIPLGPAHAGQVVALLGALAALAARARAARSPVERDAIEAELKAAASLLEPIEAANAEAIDVRRAEDSLAQLRHVATYVPASVEPRLGATEIARLDQLAATLETLRTNPGLFDRGELEAILREMAGLRARVEAQQSTDIARQERLGEAALASRERSLYEKDKLEISGADARKLGIRPGRYLPPDLDALRSDPLSRLADLVAGSGRDPGYAADLRERAEKAAHRERLAAARTAGGTVDQLVETALAGARDVFAATRGDAEAVAARLGVLLGPSSTGAPPSIHGPESHRGTGTAPDALHINAEGYWHGQHVDVHIYFPPR